MNINLFYLSLNTTGGWVTFTAHLFKSLEAMGHTPHLFKIGNNDEVKLRPFGYDIGYQNVTPATAVRLAKQDASILAAAAKQRADVAAALLAAGARAVLHDPTEVTAGFGGTLPRNPWLVRRAGLSVVPTGSFIRHPYVRRSALAKPPRKEGAVSISRIDFDKHTELILDANRLGAGIRIYGFENRLYTRFKICPNYPEWEQSKAAYPREIDAAYKILQGAKSMVDMSLIKGDGGGTQYTTLEAWDAGTVPIIQQDWLRSKDDMKIGVNCVTAATGEGILKAVNVIERKHAYRRELVAGGEKQLALHAPKKIVPLVMEWLNA